MEIELDTAKDAINQAKHLMSLSSAELMDLNEATVSPDTRFAYVESDFGHGASSAAFCT